MIGDIPLNPHEHASELLASLGGPDFDRLAALQPITLEVIAALKQQVDDEKLRNARRALEIAEAAATIAVFCVQPEAAGLALWCQGNALYHLSRYQQALDCYQRAEAIYLLHGQPLDVARLQSNQVAVLQDLGRYQAAFAIAERARATCQAIGEPAWRFLALLEMNVGAAHQQVGELDAALEAYARGHALFTRLHEAVEAARIEINRANVLQEMGMFGQAQLLLRAARATLAASDRSQEVARADHNLGKLAYRQGHYQEALQLLEAARRSFAAIPNPSEVAMVDLYRSLVYRDLNLLPETIMLAAAAGRTFKRESIHWLRAVALVNQGIGYQRLGAYAAADGLFRRAHRIYRRQGAQTRALLLDIDRAALALEEGRVAAATRAARRVVRRLDPLAWPAPVARAELVLAGCVLQGTQPNLERAERHARAAYQLAEAYHLPERAPALHMLGRVSEHTGDLVAAWWHYSAALQSVEELWARLPLDDLRLRFLDDKQPIYADVARLSQRLGTPQQTVAALNLACRAPLVRYERADAPGAAGSDGGAELWQQLQALRESWRWHQRALTGAVTLDREDLTLPVGFSGEQLRQQLSMLETEIADVTRRWQMSATNDAPAAPDGTQLLEADQAAAFCAALHGSLRSDDVVLHFYTAGDSIGASIVTPDDIYLVAELATISVVQRVLRAWRFHLEHGGELATPASIATAQAQLARLYTLLVARLEPYLAGCARAFLIVPPEWQELPFAALFDGQRYLVERLQLVYLSAPEVLVRVGREAQELLPPAPRQAVVVGYSDAQRLPQAIVEAEHVARLLAGSMATTCLLEGEASWQRLRASVPGSHLLHLATHATFRPDNPLFSWLSLADGRLTVAELCDLTLLHRPLVVLSACETGRGQPCGGGLLGMGRTFLNAGASGLVVSLWKVADQSAAQMMGDLYARLLAKGQPTDPAEALCYAQRLACARSAHPYFWASLIFVRG